MLINSNNYDDDKINYNPHITLGTFRTIEKAQAVMKKLNMSIEVNLNSPSLMIKRKCYEIIDTLEIPKTNDIISFINNVTSLLLANYKIELVGSRLYNYVDSDYDIVVLGNMDEEDYHEKMVSILHQIPSVKYVELIDSKLPTINIIVSNYDKDTYINLIYNKLKNDCISNEMVRGMINVKNCVEKLVGASYFDDFSKKYVAIRKVVKAKKIVGGNYCYPNSSCYLVMALKVYVDMLNNLNGVNKEILTKDFLFEFFKVYSNYDWKIPIIMNSIENIKNVDIMDKLKPTYCDKFLTVITLNPPYQNINRKIIYPTWKIVKDEFKNCFNNFDSKYLLKRRKITGNKIIIQLYNNIIKNRLIQKRKLEAQLFAILKDLESVNPDNEWKIYDDYYQYIIGVSDVDEAQIIINKIKMMGNTNIYYKQN